MSVMPYSAPMCYSLAGRGCKRQIFVDAAGFLSQKHTRAHTPQGKSTRVFRQGTFQHPVHPMACLRFDFPRFLLGSADFSGVGFLLSQVDTFLAAVLVLSIMAKDHEQIARDEQKTQVCFGRPAVPCIGLLFVCHLSASQEAVVHASLISDSHLVPAPAGSLCMKKTRAAKTEYSDAAEKTMLL